MNNTIAAYKYGCGSPVLADAVAWELEADNWKGVDTDGPDVYFETIGDGSQQVAHIDAIIAVFATRDGA